MRAYYLRIQPWVNGALVFVTAYFFFDFMLMLLAWRMGIHSFPAAVGLMSAKVHNVILLSAAAIYGFKRPSSSHPMSRKGYRDWLRTTPWHPRMKLPLGPVMLVWQDAMVLLVLLSLAHWHAHVSVLPVVLAFCCGYAIASLPPLLGSYSWGAYGTFFGVAFVARWIQTPEIAAPLSVALLLYTQFALRKSLQRFPWERKPPEVDHSLRQGMLALIPRDTRPLVPTRRALVGSALLGVWLWCVLSIGDAQFPPTIAGTIQGSALMAGFAAFLLLGRWTAYCGPYRAPLTLFGRIVTGRLIIPGYDYVMLAPAMALPVAALLPIGLTAMSVPWPVILSITAAVSLSIVLIAPPSMPVWQLTGTHRAIGVAAGQRTLRR